MPRLSLFCTPCLYRTAVHMHGPPAFAIILGPAACPAGAKEVFLSHCLQPIASNSKVPRGSTLPSSKHDYWLGRKQRSTAVHIGKPRPETLRYTRDLPKFPGMSIDFTDD